MENQPILICIGRQVGSGGRRIAQRLAETFNCQFYDKEILNLAAKDSGLCEKYFEQNDEQTSVFKTLLHLQMPIFGENGFYGNSFSQKSLYQFQSETIRKAATKGNCVFVGRTADYLLRGQEGMVSIFITAPLKVRTQRICNRLHTDADQALRYIQNREHERAAYYQFFTGKKWGQGESYDLCINSNILGIDDTAKYLTEFIRKKTKQDEENRNHQ